MPNIDNDTLLIALQAVYQSVKGYESRLESDTLKDTENIEELLVSYDEALKALKDLYTKQLDSGANFPPIEAILYAE